MKEQQNQTLSRRFAMQLTLASSLASFSFGNTQNQKQEPVILKVGDKFPETILRDQHGKELNLAEIHKDKLVLVDFWGVWCPPCMQEIPKLNKAYKELKEQQLKNKDGKIIAEGFEIYSIAIHTRNDHPKTWQKLVNNRDKINWEHNVEAPSGEYAYLNYGVSSIPHNFLLDQNGKILKIKINVELSSLKKLISNL